MTTLYIDRKNLSCKMEAGALVFFEEGQRCGTVPTAPLERIVFHSNVDIDTSSLGHLGQKGIGLIMLCGRSHQPTLFLPAQHHDAERRTAQYLLSLEPDYRRLVAADTLRQKFFAQKEALKALYEGQPETALLSNATAQLTAAINKLTACDTLERMLGIEGATATAYFQALAPHVPADLQFHGRNRRPPKDPFNAVLSLAYTLMAGDASLAAHAAGLDPYVGFLHALEFGRHSLACDLMEPLRPEADRFALGLFRDGTLSIERFSQSSQGCFLDKQGRSAFYPAYEHAAQAWRPKLQKAALNLAVRLVTDARTRQSTSPSSQTAGTTS